MKRRKMMERQSKPDIHIIEGDVPDEEIEFHQDDLQCPCEPYWHPENKKAYEAGEVDYKIWVHRRMDRFSGVLH